MADDDPGVFDMIPNGNVILSGGTYKIEASLVALILNIAFFAICFRVAKKSKK